MNIQSKKLQLIKLVMETENKDLLFQVKTLFEENNPKIDFWDELHDDIKTDIEASIIELDNGISISNEIVMKKHEKWLKK